MTPLLQPGPGELQPPPVGLDDLLPVAHGAVPVLHVQTHAHGLIHHVQHVDVGVSEQGAHLLLAEFTHLQQLSGGCQRVKEREATQRGTDSGLITAGRIFL